ncbi:MAG: GntR family transcriptional regulator [Gemmatimonadetes bacterium]|nr:GntR family transcriptional regulator [Gemmatimonadota bacterium]
MKRKTGALLPSLQGAGDSTPVPLHRQVYSRIRSSILAGTFAPGARLPSTRTLAADLGMSRITVESAFTQLSAEGYLVRRVGAGSYVAGALPEVIRPSRRTPQRAASTPSTQRTRGTGALSARGLAISGAALAPEPVGVRPFQPCMPALDAFPQATWARLLSRRARHGAELLSYGEAAGYRPLRQAVATYLGSARGVRCDWQQVVILTGAQQGIELASRLLLDPGDDVWHEEPGYLGARGAFLTAGANIVPVRVDADGLDVDAGIVAAPMARLAYVTPSHQFPLGATMSLARRLALLAWADRANAWILEDDYDSEFRFNGRPIAAVQGLDASGRVIYVGTFNKVMFPSLRLAYLVAPPDLVDAVVAARALGDGHPPVQSQAALTDFIGEGHFGAHVRQMRTLYHERRDVLVDALRASMGAAVRLGPVDAGMHVTLTLPRGVDDRAIAAAADEAGLAVDPLSRHYLARSSARGLLLGFTGSPAAALRRGVRTLATLL